MGWGFQAQCPACHYEWEDISTSARVGPWLTGFDVDTYQKTFRRWFCPRCYLSLSLIRSIDRNSWRKWYEKYQAEVQGRYPYLDGLVARLDESIGLGKPYTPITVDFNPGDCPACHEPFEESTEEVSHLVCPQCRSREPKLDGVYCHCSMMVDHHGFS